MMRLYSISKVVMDKTVAELTVQAANMHHAFGQYQKMADLPDRVYGEDIGCEKNPCVRYILDNGHRYYITPVENRS